MIFIYQKYIKTIMNSNYILSLQDVVQKRYLEDRQIHEAKEENGVTSFGKSKDNYFFKNILLFGASTDCLEDKTLANLCDAIKNTSTVLQMFKTDSVRYKQLSNGNIIIFDENNKFTITDKSNTDTIVIARLSTLFNEECANIIELLQDRGFYVINPIDKGRIASNKYQSSVLLEKYNIPQPRFALLTADDIAEGKKSLYEKLVEIYPNVGEDEKQDEKFEYVVKTLSGHGGVGVFMLNGTNILPVLQAVFDVDPEIELLIQKKEEGDGGDIRVHVITLHGRQIILGAMKRVMLGKGDFRSNVSLGAKVESVVLTKEQEEIAKKVAKISGMPWCAVDIMPLVKGSNKEIGDNVVLEYNMSPGTEGISEAMGLNFFKLLLDSINDASGLAYTTKTVPYLCDIDVTTEDDSNVLSTTAQLSTGTDDISTICYDKLKVTGTEVVVTIEGEDYTFEKSSEISRNREKRITVKIPSIQIGTRRLLDVEFALVDNRDKSTRVLLNRDIISRFGFVVSPNKD